MTTQTQNQEPETNWTKVVMIGVAVVIVIAVVMGFGFYGSSKNKAIAKVVAEKDSIAVVAQNALENVKTSDAAGESEKQGRYKAENEASALQSELDTIKPLALAADSLKNVAIQLQKQLAACTSKKGGKSTVVVAPIAKKLKGNPMTDDVAKTFTYAKSDSLLAKAAPAGYKLIEKPR